MKGDIKKEQKLEELIVNGTPVRDMYEMKKVITEFWGRTDGMYDSVQMNEVSLEVERRMNKHMDAETGGDDS